MMGRAPCFRWFNGAWAGGTFGAGFFNYRRLSDEKIDYEVAGGGRMDVRLNSFGLARNGDLYAVFTPAFTATPFTFGAITLPFQIGMIVAKLNAAGEWKWAKMAQMTSPAVSGLAVDQQGRTYLTGTFTSGTATLDSLMVVTSNPSQENLFFAALTADGSLDQPVMPDPAGLAAATELTLIPNPARATFQLVGAGKAPTATLYLRGLTPGLYTVRVGAASRRLVVE